MKQVRRALEQDHETLMAFLGQAGVRTEGVENGSFYLLEGEELQGAIGVEIVEQVALFRSFVIAKEVDKWNFFDFFSSVMECVKKEGVDKLYVIINSPSFLPFFQLFGFRQQKQEEIPSVIEELSHYQHAISQSEAIVLYTYLPTC